MIPTATHTTSRTYPRLIRATDQEATYRAALKLVVQIDEDLSRGTGHYRTKDGVLLVKLDEVVRAIISGDLLGPEGAVA